MSRSGTLVVPLILSGCSVVLPGADVASNGEPWRAQCNTYPAGLPAPFEGYLFESKVVSLWLEPSTQPAPREMAPSEPVTFAPILVHASSSGTQEPVASFRWYLTEPCYYRYTTGYEVRFHEPSGTLFVVGSALGGGDPQEKRALVVGIRSGEVERVIYSFNMAL